MITISGLTASKEGIGSHQTVSADWITAAGMAVAVAAVTGAQVGAAGNALEASRADLTGETRVACRASGGGGVPTGPLFRTSWGTPTTSLRQATLLEKARRDRHGKDGQIDTDRYIDRGT